jgi:hypothetical protein
MDNFKVVLFPVKTTVSVSASPSAGGVASGSGTYNIDDNVTVFAIAKEKYHFVNWTINNVVVSTDAAYSFVANNPVSLVAVFKYGQGVDDMEETTGFKVYPNPATNELTITNYEFEINNEQLTMNNVEIYDIYGRKISSHHLIPSSSNHLINISHLSSGVYFIKIINSKSFSVQKFIKE